MLAAPPVVYALAMLAALLWGFEPILGKRGMSGGGTVVQASVVVVVVDSTLYWSALLATQGLDVFAGLTRLGLAVFVAGGLFGTALGRLAVFAGVDRVGASINSAVISARPLFATALAVGALGERVSGVTVAGIVLLVAGLAVLSSARGGDLSGWRRPGGPTRTSPGRASSRRSRSSRCSRPSATPAAGWPSSTRWSRRRRFSPSSSPPSCSGTSNA